MKKVKFPPVGMRIIKSAAAVGLCYLVSFLRGNSGILFYSQLAALWCVQMYRTNTKKNAIQRLTGTVVGALYGLVYLLAQEPLWKAVPYQGWMDSLIISGMIVVVLYTTVLMKKKQASYFSCVVFLSIAVNHVSDSNPYIFVWNRFLDTVIGICIGIFVNNFSLPKKKRRDILFVSGLDGALLGGEAELSDYSKVELNRMLDDGLRFTISTRRTPASLVELMEGIRLKLPVIAMDGAALYDIQEKRFLKVHVLSCQMASQVLELIHAYSMKCFANVIIGDLLVIYHDQLEDEVQKKLVKDMRRSLYRNYVQGSLPERAPVVYFMVLDQEERINRLYQGLQEEGYGRRLKIVRYPSADYPGYSYIKIYNKNASRENMMAYLKNKLDMPKTVTFGSIPGKYDVYVEGGDGNKVVRILHQMYEPLIWKRTRP